MNLTIDGRSVRVPDGTTIYDAATQEYVRQVGDLNPIPILCHREHMEPVAVCRVCAVNVRLPRGDGKMGPDGWKLSPACIARVSEGMEVETHLSSERVRGAVTMLTELLLAEYPNPEKLKADHEAAGRGESNDELLAIAERLEIDTSRRRIPRPARPRPVDDSSFAIAVDHNACILCDRCIRACASPTVNQHIIGRTGKGYGARIAFDLDVPMDESNCVACGECMISCPTGALLSKYPVVAIPHPDTVPPDDLAQHPLFQGVPRAFLDFNEGSVTRRHFKGRDGSKPGQVICRQGDYEATAFYIEKGEVEIFLESAPGKTKGRGGLLGLFGGSNGSGGEDSEAIPVDAPVALRSDIRLGSMKAGAIFGEMACMSNYPRSATVRALTDCTLLEMGRNVFYILQRNRNTKEQLDERFRQNALDNHLRGVNVFRNIVKDEAQFQELVNYLRPLVQLQRLKNGEVVFREGDAADAYYMVRIGFVKVSKSYPGGELVLDYNGPGKAFGEIGLLHKLNDQIRSEIPNPGVRTATCTALDHVDLVRIESGVFIEMLNRFPVVRDAMIASARRYLANMRAVMRRVVETSLPEFLRQGLMNAQSLLVLDLEKCTRCDECTKACSDTHGGVTRLIREGLRFEKYLVASSCRSCLDPYCMVGCPVNSIQRKGSMEIVIQDWCIGCGRCAQNCPYGNINMHPDPRTKRLDPSSKQLVAVVQQKATTCDLCREVDHQPSCVYACPHDAAHRMSGAELIRSLRHVSASGSPK